jgi:hypothetical protein
MLTLDKIKQEDVPNVKMVHAENHSYPFPDLSNPLYVVQDLIKDENGEIVMAGIIRLTSEVILVTNKSANINKRIAALGIIAKELTRMLKELGIEDCHIFAEEDPNFIMFLKKLGFIDCTGKAMVGFVEPVRVEKTSEQKSTEDHIQ